MKGDIPLVAAMQACENALDGAALLYEELRGPVPGGLAMPEAPFVTMAELIRKIGARATPEVLVQQLIIKKHRPQGPMRRPEALAIRTFASVLMDLDAYAAELKAEAEKVTAAEAAPPKPLPIEDTTMEPADGPLETW